MRLAAVYPNTRSVIWHKANVTHTDGGKRNNKVDGSEATTYVLSLSINGPLPHSRLPCRLVHKHLLSLRGQSSRVVGGAIGSMSWSGFGVGVRGGDVERLTTARVWGWRGGVAVFVGDARTRARATAGHVGYLFESRGGGIGCVRFGCGRKEWSESTVN